MVGESTPAKPVEEEGADAEPVGAVPEEAKDAEEQPGEEQDDEVVLAELYDRPLDPRRRRPWAENLEAMTMAVVMAVLLKYFLIEAYKIPSGSMQPTLIGHESSEGSIEDRILVDKLTYRLREPKRWEVAVFRYPLDRSKNFVKRIVGLPGEELKIEGGDVWVRGGPDEDWHIPRRPRAVQRATWKALDVEDREPSSWTTTAPDWEVRQRTITARGNGEARFRPEEGSIMDDYRDGYPPAIRERVPRAHLDSGTRPVGDLRVEAELRALAGCTAVELRLREGTRSYRFRIPGPAASPAEVPSIRIRDSFVRATVRDRTEGAEQSYRLPADRAVRVAAQNLDDLLELEIDGEVVAAVEVPPALDTTSEVAIAALGEGADLADVQVYRDVHYTRDRARTPEASIPEDAYFMLGDNTQNSSDSREWAFARYRVRDPETGEERVVRGSHEQGVNPWIDVANEDGPIVWLRDEWGEQNRLPRDAAERLSPEPAPFVAREMVLGRAVAVFWPLSPLDGIYRFGWVH